ncbi:hypothetical protein P0136_01565 [Lentisphaerota bacterium ZTH]|nr:hypothetical protein JYG24_07295 [Lentisphaerota bacterium]WET06702.1 hypothetical protein P0136_01565 [Lentisphaerota bacterium ZTH]
MKMFPQLAETTVEVVCSKDISYEVEKLSILEFSRIDEQINLVNEKLETEGSEEASSLEFINIARKRIIKVLAPHFPKQPANQLWRLNYRQVTDLALHMAFGSSRQELIGSDGQHKKKAPAGSKNA